MANVQFIVANVFDVLREMETSGERFDVIVPMPLHWRKRLERGFNQSELLARFVSKRT